MLTSYTDLMNYHARLGEDAFDIIDLLFNAADGALKYLVVDTGAWLETQQTLVAASLIGAIDVEDAEVALRASREEFDQAPRWQGSDEALIPLLAALPPLVVGPFGSTYAPLAMAAELGPQSAAKDTDPRAQTAFDQFEMARGWLGSEMFGRDGPLGTLGDLLLDAEAGRVTHLVVSSDDVQPGKMLAVPYSVLRYRATGGHLVLNLTAERLRQAPQIDQMERLKRHWHADLHSYFMMPM